MKHTLCVAPMNASLWLGFALLSLVMVLVVFRFFGRQGLCALIVFNLILCNIQILKTGELFGLTTTLGNIASGDFSTA